MAYTITKNPDGDVNLGNRQGEEVTLQPAVSDYPTGGYAVVDGETANTNNTPNLINCDLWRVIGIIPLGGQGGWEPVWNPTTKKIQIFGGSAGAGLVSTEPAANTDLSAYAFQILLYGQ